MVPGAGLEPAQRERRGILNPLCLPIPPSGLGKNWRRVPESNRTRRICNPLHNRFVNAPNSSCFSARHPPEPMSFKLERETRLELATPTLARSCSTNWAIPAFIKQSVNHLILLSSGNQCRRSMRCILLTWRDESTIFFTTFDRLLKFASKRSLIKQIRSCSAQILQHWP